MSDPGASESESDDGARQSRRPPAAHHTRAAGEVAPHPAFGQELDVGLPLERTRKGSTSRAGAGSTNEQPKAPRKHSKHQGRHVAEEKDPEAPKRKHSSRDAEAGSDQEESQGAAKKRIAVERTLANLEAGSDDEDAAEDGGEGPNSSFTEAQRQPGHGGRGTPHQHGAPETGSHGRAVAREAGTTIVMGNAWWWTTHGV